MKRLRALGFCAAALFATLAAATNPGTGYAADDSFKFGGVFTLTGPAAFLGLFEDAAGGGESLRQALAHAGKLRSLAGEEKCGFRYQNGL